MQARARMRLAAISAVSLLFLAGPTSEASASIVIDNDVTVDWSNTSHCRPIFLCTRVVGAPRLVRDWAEARDRLKIVVELSREARLTRPSGAFFASSLTLHILNTDFTEVCVPLTPSTCPALQWVKDFTVEDVDKLNQDRFLELTLSNFQGFFTSVPTPAILTVEAKFTLELNSAQGCGAFARFVCPGTPLVRVTLSGYGNEITADRVGDVDGFHPGDALDIPPRSIDLVRAINQIESAFRANQGVELDATGSPGANLVVGLTHAFKVPRDDGIERAILKLRLSSGDPHSSNDFILLDRAVSNLAGKRRRVPVIFLRYLEFSHVDGTEDTFDFSIDFANVPISFLSPGDHPSPPESFNLTGDLRDGQLNVIVVGESKVDFSDLTIIHPLDDHGL